MDPRELAIRLDELAEKASRLSAAAEVLRDEAESLAAEMNELDDMEMDSPCECEMEFDDPEDEPEDEAPAPPRRRKKG